jgi:hypothetical protein
MNRQFWPKWPILTGSVVLKAQAFSRATSASNGDGVFIIAGALVPAGHHGLPKALR